MGLIKKVATSIHLYLTLILSTYLISACFSLPFGHGLASGSSNTDFISEPGLIPELHDFDTPIMAMGEADTLSFSISNRYNQSKLISNNLLDVRLTLAIYRYANLDDSMTVDGNFDFTPMIESGSSIDQFGNPVTGETTVTTVEPNTGISLFQFRWPILRTAVTYDVEILINTFPETPEGIYFMKTELFFIHEGIDNKTFLMKSIGHYDKKVWELAKNSAPEDFTGNINLTVLDVDGIIPETSFSVRVDIPFWPFYALAGGAITFAGLAVVFYYMEEHGKFPNFKRVLDRKTRKIR